MAHIVSVIVTHNNADTIGNCLTSLTAQLAQEKIIVVDCSSSDATVALIKQKFPKVQLHQAENLGYAKGNNFGIKKALLKNPKYVLILNPDTILTPGMIKELATVAEKNGNGIYGPIIYKDKEQKTVWSCGGMLDPVRYSSMLAGYNTTPKLGNKYPIQGHFISGTCLLIPAALLATHQFYEPYFMYYEDIEFCVKAAQKGYPSFCIPTAKLIHSESSTKSPIKYYYLARNHLLFVERNAPFRVQLHELLRLPKTLIEYFKSPNPAAKFGVLDYLKRKFGPYDGATQNSRSQTKANT